MTRGHAALTIAVALAGCTTAPATDAPQPQDYAYGVEVLLAQPDPFFALPVPQFIAESAVRADLSDVAVFNADGEPVPFARVDPPAVTDAATRVALRSFRLDSPGATGAPRIELDTSGEKVQLRVAPLHTPDGGAEYVLALENTTDRPVERLILDWGDDPRNWRQSVTVSTSNDLRSWVAVAVNRPLMNLQSGDDHLQHREVELERVSPTFIPGRYWRMQFGPGSVPLLTSATAEISGEARERPGLVLRTTRTDAPDGSAIYTLSAPQPVWRVRITPAEPNSLLPLQIDGRRPDGTWQRLQQTVAFRLNSRNSPSGEQYSNPVILGGDLVNAIRLRPIGTSFGSPPVVQVERRPDVLVVNARGRQPFLLAWGSRSARDAAISVNTLVPSWSNKGLAALPEGTLQTQQVLGGPSRLTEPSPAERTAQWQKALVWVLLVGGAAGLGLLAWTVWKDAASVRSDMSDA